MGKDSTAVEDVVQGKQHWGESDEDAEDDAHDGDEGGWIHDWRSDGIAILLLQGRELEANPSMY